MFINPDYIQIKMKKKYVHKAPTPHRWKIRNSNLTKKIFAGLALACVIITLFFTLKSCGMIKEKPIINTTVKQDIYETIKIEEVEEPKTEKKQEKAEEKEETKKEIKPKKIEPEMISMPLEGEIEMCSGENEYLTYSLCKTECKDQCDKNSKTNCYDCHKVKKQITYQESCNPNFHTKDDCLKDCKGRCSKILSSGCYQCIEQESMPELEDIQYTISQGGSGFGCPPPKDHQYIGAIENKDGQIIHEGDITILPNRYIYQIRYVDGFLACFYESGIFEFNPECIEDPHCDEAIIENDIICFDGICEFNINEGIIHIG